MRLETLPKPTFRDKSRVRSIGTVMKDIEMKLNEISTQKEEHAASKVRRTQERGVPAVTASATSIPPKAKEVSVETAGTVRAVTPPSSQPLTVEQLMAGLIQTVGQPVPTMDSPKAQSPPPQVPQPTSVPVPPSLAGHHCQSHRYLWARHLNSRFLHQG